MFTDSNEKFSVFDLINCRSLRMMGENFIFHNPHRLSNSFLSSFFHILRNLMKWKHFEFSRDSTYVWELRVEMVWETKDGNSFTQSTTTQNHPHDLSQVSPTSILFPSIPTLWWPFHSKCHSKMISSLELSRWISMWWIKSLFESSVRPSRRSTKNSQHIIKLNQSQYLF